jgi:hypothetical protein
MKQTKIYEFFQDGCDCHDRMKNRHKRQRTRTAAVDNQTTQSSVKNMKITDFMSDSK